MRFGRLASALGVPAMTIAVVATCAPLMGCAQKGAAVANGGGIVAIAYGMPPKTGDWHLEGVAIRGDHKGSTVWRLLAAAGLTAAAAAEARDQAKDAVGGAAEAAADNPTNPCEGKPDDFELASFTIKGMPGPRLNCRGWNEIRQKHLSQLKRMGKDGPRNVMRCIAQVLNWGTGKMVKTTRQYALVQNPLSGPLISVVALSEDGSEILWGLSSSWSKCANYK